MRQSNETKLLAVVEAATVTGPARNLLDFFASTSGPSQAPEDDLGYICPTLATYHRSQPSNMPSSSGGPVDAGGQEFVNQFVTRARAQNIPVDVIAERYPFDLRVVPGLREAIARRLPDIVETHHVKSHFLMRLTGAGKKRPWVAFHHGYTATDAKVRAYNHLDRWSLRAAHRVITVSHAFSSDLQAIGVPKERILVLHNSIAPDWFDAMHERTKSAWRNQLALPQDERIVLAVGRFSKEKALADLVTAFANLRRAHPQIKTRLVLVGDGPERGPVEQLAAELKVREQILFAGQVSDPRPYYAAADVLALPSLSEGSPLALLEAMAAALPIVATAVGGVPEMVETNRNALLIAPRRPDDLANALGQLLSDAPLAQRLGQAALETSRTRFTPAAHRTARLKFYRELLKNRIAH